MKKLGYISFFIFFIFIVASSLFADGYLAIDKEEGLLVWNNSEYLSLKEISNEIHTDHAKIILPLLTIAVMFLVHRTFKRFRLRCRHCGSRDTQEITRESHYSGGTIYMRCNKCFQEYEVITLAAPGSSGGQ